MSPRNKNCPDKAKICLFLKETKNPGANNGYHGFAYVDERISYLNVLNKLPIRQTPSINYNSIENVNVMHLKKDGKQIVTLNHPAEKLIELIMKACKIRGNINNR